MSKSVISRWWIYQKERFPLIKNGVLIAVFSTAALGYSRLLRQADASFPDLGKVAIAFVVLLLMFLQLRIADEFKDFQEDARYRPYRPVPRGLVTLSELAALGVGCGVIQLGVSLPWGLPMVGLLVLLWSYYGLMCREFFVPQWLKAHPLVYMLSHMMIMPLMAFYASAWDWLPVETSPSIALIRFLGVSIGVGCLIEIGRKIRAPQDEEPGVETYSALWGRQQATIAWLWCLCATLGLALWSAQRIGAIVLLAVVTLLSLTAAVIVVWRFLSYPVSTWAKGFELVTAGSTFLIYLSLGILPFWLA